MPSHCVFDPATADFVIEGWHVLEAVAGDYLITSEGSSAARTLFVFDLNTGDAILEADADYVDSDPDGLRYWERREEATAENCPQFEEYGGFGVIAHEMQFSFAAGKAKALGETRCDYVE